MTPVKKIGFQSKEDTNFGFEITTINAFNQPRIMRIASKHYRVNFYTILYVSEGAGCHEVDFESFPLKAGDVVLVNRHRVHRYTLNESMKGFIIHFTDSFLYKKDIVHAVDIIEPFLRQYESPVVSLNGIEGSVSRDIFELLMTLFLEPDSDVKPALVHSHLRTLMLYIHQQASLVKRDKEPFKYQIFMDFMELVESHYKDKHTVAEYADLLHVSPKTVNAYTRKAVDKSAKQFIIDRLVLEIKRYLSTGDMTMSQIAEELGFTEQTNMTKFFKRYTGMVPSDFVSESMKNQDRGL